ncbi:unnamed protein product [Lactuca virosa]|uniref:Uncharacterized protein n=1 Tax=Lactuca virosa TaxID=75947 RepID=A0AAU9NU12_9ASTR|nr:unnamed protein product [Lactuca virosa]
MVGHRRSCPLAVQICRNTQQIDQFPSYFGWGCFQEKQMITKPISGIQGHDLLQEKQTQLAVSFEKHTQFVHLSYCVNR